MEELSLMLTGEGIYNRTIPSLRFLAFITLCPDGDSHTLAGHAANVKFRGRSTKQAALKCTSTLRRTCDTTLLRCRATSRNAANNFERRLKPMLMPEYSVPFAYHLLAFQPDTPSCGLNRKSGESADSYKLLRKRLTWLFDTLVKSLGTSADNISFLLRQSELLGHRYTPIEFDLSDNQTLADDASLGSTKSSHNSVLRSRLTVICSTAREVLMKFVKKDVNLTPYPGGIQFPAALFKAIKNGTPNQTVESNVGEKESLQIVKADTRLDSGKKSVHFDDSDMSDVSAKGLDALKLQLSPIPLSGSPESRNAFKTPSSAGEESLNTPLSLEPRSTSSKKRPHSAETPGSSGEKRTRRSSRLSNK